MTDNRKELDKLMQVIPRKPPLDPLVNEVCFRFWIAGKTFAEINEILKGTPFETTLKNIHRASTKYQWEKRKNKIFSNLQTKTNDQIEFINSKRLSMMNSIILEMDKELNTYLVAPDKEAIAKPTWWPKSTRDFLELLKVYDHVLNGGVNKSEIDLKNTLNFGLEIEDSDAAAMLKILSNAATKKLMQGTNSEVIEAEFEEELIQQINESDPTKSS